MDCEEKRVDMRELTPSDMENMARMSKLVFELNHTDPTSPAYGEKLKELFGDRLGENSTVRAPIEGAALDMLKIGKNVFINSNFLAMARGGITIEDGVMIAANVQLLSNNHDVYDRNILLCKPVVIAEGAWIGAGATILPGVRIGRYAVVGAAAVVTKDVPDYGVVVGSPAKVIKMLDPEKFPKDPDH